MGGKISVSRSCGVNNIYRGGIDIWRQESFLVISRG